MISDMDTGVWFFKMDGFSGWNGHDWGVPNVSSVQDYDHGPEGASAPAGKPDGEPLNGNRRLAARDCEASRTATGLAVISS